MRLNFMERKVSVRAAQEWERVSVRGWVRERGNKRGFVTDLNIIVIFFTRTLIIVHR
jgi:hypothetical protein